MGPTEIFWTAAPIVFTGGGMYALFKWRINKLEEAVKDMAEACVHNRTTCNGNITKQLDSMTEEFRGLFHESSADRKELRKELNETNILLARLDQRQLNGHGAHK